MKKTVILHIGRHKTGTTGIQLFLDSNSAELSEAGFCYPITGRDQSAGQSEADRAAHHGLARSLMGSREVARERLRSLRPAFLDEVKDAKTIIMSSEGFQNIQHLDLLSEFFEGFHIETVCYLREYLAYVVSAYAQEIKGSSLTSDFLFFEQRFGLNLPSFVSRWEEATHRCTWRLYSRDQLIGGDVVTDFIDMAGLPLEPHRISSEPNPSISGNLLGFKLILNMLGLHQREFGVPMNNLAGAHSQFRGQIFVDRPTQKLLRGRNLCNQFMKSLFEEVPEFDFEQGNQMFDPATLRIDLDLILPEFATFDNVLKHPLIAGLTSERLVAAELLS